MLLEAKVPMNILHPKIAKLLTPDHRDSDGVGWVSNKTAAKMMDGGQFKQVMKEIRNDNLTALQVRDDGDSDSDYIERNNKYKD